MWRLWTKSLLPLCAIANGLLAQPFFFRKDLRVGEAPYAIVPGDFNADGRLDLGVGTGDGFYVLLNAGGVNFDRPVRTEADLETFWLGAGADFNGDGRDDLVGSGFLYLSRGDGTFEPPRYVGVQEAVSAGDFNRDGKTDLLISNKSGVRVLLGNGDGTFQSGAVVSSTPMRWVRVADLNCDGRTDVAGTLEQPAPGNLLLVFLDRGDGTFGSEVRTAIRGYSLIADFNGDKVPDLFTQTWGGAVHEVMFGKGDGSFQSPVAYAEVRPGVAAAAADFTGDGYADLVTSVWDRGFRSYLYPSKGDGTLLPPVDLPVGAASAPAAVDVDGDGGLDLVAVGHSFNLVSVLMSRDQWDPALRRAVSAAVNTAIVAPASLASLYTSAAATASESASPPWPTRLGGIELEVRDSTGATRPAPLLFVSPTQINFQVPAGTALGEATLAIADGSGTTVAGSMAVEAVAPALFPQSTWVMVEPDGSQGPTAVCDPWGDLLSWWSCQIPLSTAGDRAIHVSLYGTGFDGINPENVTCSANDVPLPVVYAGPQGTPGLDQITIRLLPKVFQTDLWGWDGVQVTVRIDGVRSNPVWFWVF